MQPFDLERAVSGQSWEWLFDLALRLDVIVELIDPRDVPLFPIGSTPAAAAIRRMLKTHEPPLAAAVSTARHSPTAAPVRVDGYEVLCLPLSPAGVLLLAQKLTGEGPAAGWRHDLVFIGSWLTGAIEASLMNPPHTVGEEAYRIGSLRRILSEAVSYGSARTVIGAFVEALGVWDDIRIRCYAAATSGRFFHYVSPVGALSSSVPPELDAGAVPGDGRVVGLSRSEADRLGFSSDPGDVVMLQVSTGADVKWLLICSGAIDGRGQARLTFYADILRESLRDVHEKMASRLVPAVSRHRLGPNERLEVAANAALQELAAAVGAPDAALVVTTVTGIRALNVGNANLASALDHDSGVERLAVTSSDTASIMTVVVARDHPAFLAFERELLKAAARSLHHWIESALQQSFEAERRREPRPLASLLDHLAASAIRAGQQASAIVVSVDASAASPALMQSWLGTIRGQLRAGDFAGLLSEREIAVLLCDTSAEQAAAVSMRLRQLMGSDEAAGVFLQPALGAITRSPESPFEGSLVAAARAGSAAIR